MNHTQELGRREFIKTTGAATLGGALSVQFAVPSVGRPLKSNTLKIGLIGCGGRGTGAANQALNADPDVILTHMADVFEDRVEQSYQNLLKEHPERVKVKKRNRRVGFDAYQKVIDSDVDVILLATPPYFRPMHIEAVVQAGKHLFAEKPMAVDAPGVRRVLESIKVARQKQVSVVSGFCWRYHSPKRATFARVLDGSIGNVHTVYNTYNTGELWLRDTQPDWTEMQKKMRNWLYYNWISGDHIVEQAVHSIDMMSWAMGDAAPVKAVGTGGRQVRTAPEYGNIYDHFAVVYEYEGGGKGFHFSRQQKNTARSYALDILGSEGRCTIDCSRRKHVIEGAENWHFEGEENNMYQQEHDELFASVRSGKPIDDGDFMARSTMLAIMGRMVAYTGQEITYDQALQSQEKLGPEHVDSDTQFEELPVALPGKTKFI